MAENQITVEQTQKFLEKLPEDKLSILKGFVEDKFPKKEETADDIKKAELNEINLRNSTQRLSAINACDPSAQIKGFCWQQFIEYHQSGSVSSNVGASWHQRYTTICDNDASDTDLVVFFNVPSNNPDKIRWRTTSERIAFLAVVSNNMSLNGFDFDNQGVHLCIGNGIADPINDDGFIKNNITIISIP